MKRLVVPFFVVALLAGAACDDEGDGNISDGAAGAGGIRTDGGAGSTAGAGGGVTAGAGGGAAGGAGGGGAGGASTNMDGGTDARNDGGGGARNDGSADAVSTADAGAKPAWAMMCTDPESGISAADFCSFYTTSCDDYYGQGSKKFASEADCMTKYAAFTATQMGCAAYHLCVAAMPGMAMVHCPHPAGGTQNPCGL